MRKYLSVLVSVLICGMLPAQIVSDAAKSYEIFATYNSNGSQGDELYDPLYECFQTGMALLNSSMANSDGEVEAKNILKSIWPHLYNAAVYYQNTDPEKSVRFARAYVDIPMHGSFSRVSLEKGEQYPMIVYYAASRTFNAREYKDAIKYFREYIATGETTHRRNVYLYMSHACDNIKDFSLSQKVLDQALLEYPNDYELLARAINNCIDFGDNEKLLSYVNSALKIRPDDKALLGILGKTYENTGEYQKAAECYERLKAGDPNNLNIYRHLAVNYYNTAVKYYNDSIFLGEGGNVSDYDRMVKENFTASIQYLRGVVDNDPSSSQFWEALAIAYNYTGNEAGFNMANNKLMSIGAGRITKTVIPEIISLDGAKKGTALNMAMAEEIPTFPEFARNYISPTLEKWQAKDPYETISEYQHRVNPETREEKINELTQEAIDTYVDRFSPKIRASDFQLKPYDAENEVFLAESRFGEVIIPVPRANNEARNFEANWNGVSLSDVKYCIDGDRLALKSIVFISPTGKSYEYDNANALNYTVAQVNIDADDFNYSSIASSGKGDQKKVRKTTVNLYSGSDVDKDIPQASQLNPKTFAVIIANEDYSMVSHVPMALNDGRVFAEYCRRTLGLPDNNVRLYENATYGTMISAMREIQQISKVYHGDVKILFYYSGHGLPNESTKDAFLLPVDSDGLSTEICYPVSRLYRELGDLDAEYVIALLDACFSGASKDGEMLSSSSRGVAIVAKPNQPQGNMIAFSAASGNETAYPYESMGHGLFTYFLLKKLQETSGNVTLKELSDYVTENVTRQAVVVNHKAQTPVLTPSFSMEEVWKNIVISQ